MDSTVAGFFQCHTTQDVLSPDHLVLMPAGTRFTGTYKKALIAFAVDTGYSASLAERGQHEHSGI